MSFSFGVILFPIQHIAVDTRDESGQVTQVLRD